MSKTDDDNTLLREGDRLAEELESTDSADLDSLAEEALSGEETNDSVDLSTVRLSEPTNSFKNFYKKSSTTIEKIRQTICAPDKKRKPRRFNRTQAAENIGVSSTFLRTLELKKEIPAATPDPTNKRLRTYSQAEVHEIRRIIGRDPKRPEGSECAIMCTSNMKGGVGKSTTATHAASYFALHGLRTLIIDTDVQGSASLTFDIVTNFECRGYEHGLYEPLLENPKSIKEKIIPTHVEGLHIIPSAPCNQELDWLLTTRKNEDKLGYNHMRLTKALDRIKPLYDVIIIDTSPSMNLLTINSMTAANMMLVPFTPSMLAFAASVEFLNTTASVMEYAGKLDLFRVLITQHPGTNTSKSAERIIRAIFGKYVLENSMVKSAELERSEADMGTLYDVQKPKKDARTLARALDQMALVHDELYGLIQAVWADQAAKSKGAA